MSGPMNRRIAGAFAAMSMTAVLLTGCGGDSGTTPSSSSHPASTASPSEPPFATGSPPATEGEVSDPSASAASEPPAAEADGDYGDIVIDSIGVDADLVGVGLNDDGSMQTPQYHTNTAGWYTEGPEPGEQGPAVVVAHVDGPNGVDVFQDLEDVATGDEIVVTGGDGVAHTFVVTDSTVADKDELPYDVIWPQTDEVLLTLITCDGPYTDGEYEDNFIVFAEEA